MKKVLVVLLSVIMLLQLCGCGQSSNQGYYQNSQYVSCPSCSSVQSSDATYCNKCGSILSGSSGFGYPANPGGSGYNGGGYNGGGEIEGGEDYFTCLICNGKGYTECYAGCRGGCSFCTGGYVDCGCDNGVIYYGGGGSTSTGPIYESQPCTNCKNGSVTCYRCNGTGRYGTYTVGGFDGTKGAEVEKICPTCGGSKVTSCSVCFGMGYTY